MKCPGQDMQYWNQEAIFEADCPQCGHAVEFYKDDTTRTCKKCGHRFVNPKMDFGCAAYCKFAEQCIGTLPEEFVGSRDNLLKDKVAVEMKRFYKTDFKRIGQMMRVARHAEKIGIQEGANLAVVLCASYLDGTGQEQAQRKYGGSDPRLVRQESAEIARSMLTDLGAKQAMIEEVCRLLETPGETSASASPEQQTLNDARLIAHLEDLYQNQQLDNTELTELLAEVMAEQLTSKGGRHEAQATFRQVKAAR